MKRHLSLLASVVLVVVMVFALASCEYVQNLIPGINQTHDHKYVDGKCEVCGEADPNYKAPCEQHTYAEGVCTVCGAADPDYKPECAEHSFGAPVVTKTQTCTEKGERTFTCTVCGYADVKEIAPDGHTGGTATCQSKKICTVCGEAYGELGAHKDVVISAVEATCEKDGSTEGKMCEVCETILVQPEVIPGGHKGGEATCQAKAVCTVCGVAYGELGDHKYEEIPAVEPTCTEPGSLGGSKCSVCDEYEKDADGNDILPETLDALGHNFVEGQCDRCRLYHEDYKGVKTHYFIFSDLAEGDKDKAPVLGTLAHGYYTVNGNVVQRIDSKGYHSIELGKFGTGAISFTVTGTAHVEIELSSTGGSNTSWIGLIDEDGNLIANNEEKYSVTGASKGWTVFTWDLEAGTYYVVSPDVRIPILDENGNPVLDEDGNPTYEKIDPDAEDSKSIEVDPATGLPLVNDNGEMIAYNRGMRLRYISVTETPAEEDETLKGAIDVTTTDTYCYIDEYTFTAPVAGTYTFTLPLGLGFWSEKSGAGPEIDSLGLYYDPEVPHTVEIYLAEGEELSFTVGAVTMDSWTITWTGVAGEASDDGDEPAAGGFTGVYDATDDWGNVMSVVITDTTITFQPMRSPEVVWTYELDGDVITIYSDGTALTNPMFGSVTVENGVPTVLSYNMTDYKLTRAGASGDDGEDEIPTKDLANGYNSVDGSSVNFVYTATEAGKLDLSIGAFLGECAITYTVNGDDAIELAANSSVTLDLYAGDKVVIYVVTDGGYTTITVAWDNGSAGGDTDEPGEGGEGGEGGEEGDITISGTLTDEEENTVTITEDDLAAGKVYYSFMPYYSGEYQFLSMDLYISGVSLDGVAVEANDNGFYVLESYTSYVVEITLGEWISASDYIVTPDYQYPLGSSQNPNFFYGFGEGIEVSYSGGVVWYSFFASANGTVTVTCEDANVSLQIGMNSNYVIEGTETISLNVIKGLQYFIGVADFVNIDQDTWEYNGSGKITFTPTFTEGDYVGDGSYSMPYIISLDSANSINLESWWSGWYAFTTETAGTLSVTTANENCVWYFYGQEEWATAGDKSIHVAWGELVHLYVENSGSATTTIEFNASFKADPTEVYYEGEFAVDTPNTITVADNTYVSIPVYAGGMYTVTWTNENAVVKCQAGWDNPAVEIANGDTITVQMQTGGATLYVSLKDYVAGEVVITLTNVTPEEA